MIAPPPPPARRSDRLYDAGFFLVEAFASLEVTAVIVANVHIARSLAIAPLHANWILNSYLYPLFGCMFILLAASKHVHRWFCPARLFLTGLMIFAAGNILAAVSTSALPFFAARAIMGVGGALAFAGQLWTLSNYHRPRMQAPLVWGEAGAALGIIAGPLVGALFVHFSTEGWRWFFFLNAGLAVVSAIFAHVGLRGRPPASDAAEAAEHPSTPRQVRVMTLWQVAVSILIVGAEYLFSDYMQKEAHKSAMFVGGMTVLASIGAIAGSAWAAGLKQLDPLPKLSALGLLSALALLAFCLDRAWYVAAGAPIFAAGLFMGLASVSIYTNIVKVSHPSRFLSRSMVYLIAMQMGNALGVQMVGLAELNRMSVLGTGLMVGAIPAALTAVILLRQFINPLQLIPLDDSEVEPRITL